MKTVACIFVSVLCLTSCAHQSAMPLGNDLMQIDVSAAPVYGRAGAQRMAFEEAAKATLDAGYDKFVVVNNAGWNEATVSGFSSGSFNATQNYASGGYSGGFGTLRHPESSMVIHMFHNGEKGAEKAVDARSVLAASK